MEHTKEQKTVRKYQTITGWWFLTTKRLAPGIICNDVDNAGFVSFCNGTVNSQNSEEYSVITEILAGVLRQLDIKVNKCID